MKEIVIKSLALGTMSVISFNELRCLYLYCMTVSYQNRRILIDLNTLFNHFQHFSKHVIHMTGLHAIIIS